MSEFLNPQQLINRLPLKEDGLVAEFGAGSGGWTIPLAKKLEGGRVYAFEIQPEAISALKGRADLEGVHNIETRLCDLEEPEATRLGKASVDMVLIANVLFQAQDKIAVLKEAKRILKPDGKLIIIDWHPAASLGPKENATRPEELKNLLQNLDLEVEKESDEGAFHYLLVGKHKSP